ncbi:MAG: pyruvate:ferredoxin (flavodoxin) oxidoreductase [Candidatus Muirbacterium halophilum]|nr:pyruvate:ferredoxin (flavodoxin) oxidoreductase [Candidatus Muirbacterium halophilum]MCK9474411.1 pyruvate:ferredoxin (flavodoxin) oxidoreductase [Candidatus Muirbacterium halophilum]
MADRKMVTIDGNSATTHVAHAINEVIAIYPITPSSGMGEISDEKSAKGEKNIWGTIPRVAEMQSEGGAAGAVHGSLSAGALTTTFTASQGLLLMIPNMFKIAGELTPTVFHVTARAIATHALSIFGEHSDVMACRGTGWGMLASSNPQEAMDFALISQAASLESRIPFIHFFDGFRTSHEIQKVEELTKDDMKAMVEDKYVREFRERSLNPEKPILKGTAQNPDVFFQSREAINPFYDKCPSIVEKYMAKFAKITGRKYNLVDYVGAEDAEKVVVIMTSGADVAHETVDEMLKNNEKVGVLKLRLYRPFPTESFINAIPKTVKKIAVLDRTKEAGGVGEPLYTDVVTVIGQAYASNKINEYPVIVGGRYGLGSKDFTPPMVKAVFDNLDAKNPINSFSVGVNDDVTNRSLAYDVNFKTSQEGVINAMFFGLGSDGTVGANKNTAKIIGTKTNKYLNAYFVYDSKKAGSMTVSHLRFADNPLRSSYLIQPGQANLVACHNFSFIEKYEMVSFLKENGIFLINSSFNKDEVWANMPYEVQKELIEKKARIYTINAVQIAEDLGLGGRINTVMQAAFFKIADSLIPYDKAVEYMKEANKKSYGKAGEKVIQINNKAIDVASESLHKVELPTKATSKIHVNACKIPKGISDFLKNTTCELIAQRGDQLPVSAMPVDGIFPLSTARLEKRNIAVNIPVWNPETCIQCGICSFVCPHATIRMKVYDKEELNNAPETFKSADSKIPQYKDKKFTIQVAPEDCTGCGSCVFNCPMKAKEAIKMERQAPLRDQEAANFDFFFDIPELSFKEHTKDNLRNIQLSPHMFEFSGACAGCGETPYVRLLSQLFGDRALIANATGCSSIYGGNLPTTPYCQRPDGKGVAWNNSLFEDNAEVGYGMRLAADKFKDIANDYLDKMSDKLDSSLVKEIKEAVQVEQKDIEMQRERVAKLKDALKKINSEDARNLEGVADYLIKKSVWIVGGDGWAYDIGYGGLDHVLAQPDNINILVMDTEVYSNTGGQSSKATPIGANAKFAFNGKAVEKKDLGMIAMTYGHIYVAHVSLANPQQVIKAFIEAEKHNGPSLVIAYAHCIAHGINMTEGIQEQKNAVNSGHWMLYRFDPALAAEGKNPLQIDSKEPSITLDEFMNRQTRFKIVQKMYPERAKELAKKSQKAVMKKYSIYKQLADNMDCSDK